MRLDEGDMKQWKHTQNKFSRWQLHNQSQHHQLWQKKTREERDHYQILVVTWSTIQIWKIGSKDKDNSPHQTSKENLRVVQKEGFNTNQQEYAQIWYVLQLK